MIGDKPDEKIRTPMEWSSSPNGGFTGATPWEALQPDWREKNVAAQDSVEGSLLNHYRRLIHLRNAHAALSHGRLVVLSTSDQRVAAFIRETKGERLLVVVNFGDSTATNLLIVAAAAFPHAKQRFSDPGGCREAGSFGRGSVRIAAVGARSLCVFQVSGER